RLIPYKTHYAYLKIADGCDHSCSFCIIPKLKGPYRSRPIRDIEDEARELVASGIREIILIAQDTTYYGIDTHGKRMLPELLKRLSRIQGLSWLRLLYTTPDGINDELLSVMAGSDIICNYIDMPIQHISRTVLKKMKRWGSKSQFINLIGKIRRTLPGVAIRSTFIVGHPGEGKKEFEELLEFLSEVRLERVGIFPFSPEKGTESYELRPKVHKNTKMKRYNDAMRLLQEISREKNKKLIGQVMPVIVDDVFPKGNFPPGGKEPDHWLSGVTAVGRTFMDAPEIDGRVYLEGDVPPPGSIIKAVIRDASIYDFFARIGECDS
ncbi:MAG: MiaB/RimO family radical SAM methylthiotransferase, partial [Candidatus Eremiobacteraeota bacterium]|nr:MiaB/RimO family radical SAM methylthiotransferase [Candidatus Eremiobacteraeota bacterium]